MGFPSPIPLDVDLSHWPGESDLIDEKGSDFSLKDDGTDTEATDTGCEEAQEDVSRGDKPESENVHGSIAVIRIALIDLIH